MDDAFTKQDSQIDAEHKYGRYSHANLPDVSVEPKYNDIDDEPRKEEYAQPMPFAGGVVDYEFLVERRVTLDQVVQ